MFYETEKNNHGLPYNPFKSICVPRPIAWISSLSKTGVLNIAPFSQFTNLSYDPPMIVFSSSDRTEGTQKDTVQNILDTKEFVVNMATWDLREQVEITGQAVGPEVDEAKLAGLAMTPSNMVRAPRIAQSPVQMECAFHASMTLPGRKGPHHLMVGRVIGVHIKDEVIGADGKLDILKIRPLARLGYLDYTSVESFFTMLPKGPGAEAAARGRSGQP
ncbi:MAG: flavin reductase family protein [Betaproteobacteria bacterium]|nr:flavin reductase family protein [Betaproteobacteria bacterium]